MWCIFRLQVKWRSFCYFQPWCWWCGASLKALGWENVHPLAPQDLIAPFLCIVCLGNAKLSTAISGNGLLNVVHAQQAPIALGQITVWTENVILDVKSANVEFNPDGVTIVLVVISAGNESVNVYVESRCSYLGRIIICILCEYNRKNGDWINMMIESVSPTFCSFITALSFSSDPNNFRKEI